MQTKILPEPLLQLIRTDEVKVRESHGEVHLIPVKRKMSREEVFGCMRGQYDMSDDFDAPLEDFREYIW